MRTILALLNVTGSLSKKTSNGELIGDTEMGQAEDLGQIITRKTTSAVLIIEQHIMCWLWVHAKGFDI